MSVHAYAHLTDRYLLCTCGASMGDRYGPMVVARRRCAPDGFEIGRHRRARHADHRLSRPAAVPGRRFRARRRALRPDSRRGRRGRISKASAIDAGLVIHEGQLTYRRPEARTCRRYRPVVVRRRPACRCRWAPTRSARTWGRQSSATCTACCRRASRYGLEHREEALGYALSFGRGLDRGKADQFVEMYVNDWTLDFGPRGRQAVAELLARRHAPA